MQDSRDQLKHERESARETQAKNPTELALCDAFMGQVTDGFNALPRSFKWEHLNGTILLLAALGSDSLRWALETMLKGYYGQANALSRQAWECWLNGAYLVLYPDEVEGWRKRTPKPKTMRRRVAERLAELGGQVADEAGSRMADIYWNYSGFVHPNEKSTAALLAKAGEGEFDLRLGGKYHHALVVQSTDMFCHAAEMLFTLLYVLIPGDKDYQSRGDALRRRLSEWRQQVADKAREDPEP